MAGACPTARPRRETHSRSTRRDLILIAAVALPAAAGIAAHCRACHGRRAAQLPAGARDLPPAPAVRPDVSRRHPPDPPRVRLHRRLDARLAHRPDPHAADHQPPDVVGDAARHRARRGGTSPSRTTCSAPDVTPKAAIIFFRDYNLTDVMFRLDAAFRWSIDTVAGPEEPELNAVLARRRQGGWSAVHDLVERTYHVAPLMARADDRLSQWPADQLVGPRRAAAFTKDMNALFAFEKLRPMADADMAAEAGAGRLRGEPADLDPSRARPPGEVARRAPGVCPRAATPAARRPAAAVAGAAEIRRRPARVPGVGGCAVHRRHRQPGIHARLVQGRRPHARQSGAASTPRCSRRPPRRCSNDLPLARLRRFLPPHRHAVLAAVASLAEPPAAGRQLRLLRVGDARGS